MTYWFRIHENLNYSSSTLHNGSIQYVMLRNGGCSLGGSFDFLLFVPLEGNVSLQYEGRKRERKKEREI